MNDKLKGFKDEGNLTDDQIIRRAEAQKADLNDIDPETSVAKGDEQTPSGTGEYADKMKTLYSKSRNNRDLVQREEAEGSPDVAMIQRMNAEAAGGEKPTTEIDTNKPDRFAADRGEETEEQYTARLLKEQEEAERGDDLGNASQNKSKNDVKTALPDSESDATVEVQILGRVLTVPKQDIDDAGGIAAYQKSRTATLKLQRAATLEEKARALLTKAESEQGQGGAQIADPSTDGPSEADIESLYEEMMDVVVDGTEEDQRKWLQKLQQRKAQKQTTPTDTRSQEPPKPKEKSEIQKELDAQLEADRVEANQMMIKDFPDIMGDTELLGLAKTRFNALKANPNNEGRTQKEMAREAANFVRNLGKRVSGGYQQPPSTVEADRQTRIERKRQLPQQSRADHQAPARPSQDNKVPSRKEHFQRLREMQGHRD